MSSKRKIKTRVNGEVELYGDDEVYIEMFTSLGLTLMSGIMPSEMRDGVIKSYLESEAVNSYYLYVDGKEITDGLNHNMFNGFGV